MALDEMAMALDEMSLDEMGLALDQRAIHHQIRSISPASKKGTILIRQIGRDSIGRDGIGRNDIGRNGN